MCVCPTAIPFLNGRPSKAESELEFCAAYCRAGRQTISLEKCDGGVTLACIQKMGEGIFHLTTAEVGGGELDEGMGLLLTHLFPTLPS